MNSQIWFLLIAIFSSVHMITELAWFDKDLKEKFKQFERDHIEFHFLSMTTFFLNLFMCIASISFWYIILIAMDIAHGSKKEEWEKSTVFKYIDIVSFIIGYSYAIYYAFVNELCFFINEITLKLIQ